MEDIFSVLKSEHKIVKENIQDLLDGKNNNFDEIVVDLNRHFDGEERIVYAVFANYSRLRDLIIEALEEHKHAKMILDELIAMDTSEEEFRPKLKVLLEMLQHHIQEEEQAMFPLARRNINKTVIESITKNYLSRFNIESAPSI